MECVGTCRASIHAQRSCDRQPYLIAQSGKQDATRRGSRSVVEPTRTRDDAMSARKQRGRVWPLRRPSFLRLAFVLLGALLALQVSTIAVLSFVVASRRRLRRPLQGFPHLRTPEVAVSDNQLKISSYARELFNAMIAAIAFAKEGINLVTFLWKRDAAATG